MAGTVTLSQKVQAVSGAVNVEQSFKGNVKFGHSYDDFLDVNVSQIVSASALSQTSGGVSMTLKGTITNSSGTYTFDEAVSVTPGKISVDISGGKK